MESKRNLESIRGLISGLTAPDYRQLGKDVADEQHSFMETVFTSLREIIHNRDSADRDHEGVRSTVISACCGYHVDLSKLSCLLGIYENRNFHKLQLYKARREAYMLGRSRTMTGERYASNHYGFSTLVIQFLRRWFDDDDCSTPDIYGRKVVYADTNGMKSYKVIRHMKAGDREENHALFIKLRGAECLQLCSKSMKATGSKMKLRIPG